MSLPIYPDRQTPSAQYRQWLMGVTGDALCVVGDLIYVPIFFFPPTALADI